MLRNYWKIAFRNMAKHKFISFINLFGLTIGMTCCLLILTYILHEVSYDKYNSKADRIYRVTRSFNNKEGITSLHLGAVAPPFGPLLQNEFPDIEKISRLLPIGTIPTRYEEKNCNYKDVFFGDDNFLGIFDIPMLKGNPATALTDPYSVILTEDVAKKYFGNADPIGQALLYDKNTRLEITGVAADPPSNTELDFDFVGSLAGAETMPIFKGLLDPARFAGGNFNTYFRLRDASAAPKVARTIRTNSSYSIRPPARRGRSERHNSLHPGLR